MKTVKLTPGTTVLTRDPGDRDPENPWTGWTRYTVEEGDEITMVVERKGVSHSTMNGGGFDFYGHCPFSYLEMQVRTTLSRPESSTFQEV